MDLLSSVTLQLATDKRRSSVNLTFGRPCTLRNGNSHPTGSMRTPD
jgi:hypothetical protein